MNRLALAAAVSFFMGLTVFGCDDDDSNPVTHDLSVEFLGHANDGCSNLSASAQESGCTAYLTGYEVLGDTLILNIHFVANCCPRFSEDVSCVNNTVSIAVVDMRQGCDCICPFDNVFSFHFTGSGDLHIDFTSTSNLQCDFDTLIALQD